MRDHVRNYYVLLHYLLISVNEVVLMNFFDDDVTARRESRHDVVYGVLGVCGAITKLS